MNNITTTTSSVIMRRNTCKAIRSAFSYSSLFTICHRSLHNRSILCQTGLAHPPQSLNTSHPEYADDEDEHEHLNGSAREAVNNLLYNVSAPRLQPSRRTLCALVSNEPGVLSRVSGCLAGRGFNIDSLVVSETETVGLSRMTIVLRGGEDVDQARKQLEDLVQVWAVVEFSPFVPTVERELMLVKLNINPPVTGNNLPFTARTSSANNNSSYKLNGTVNQRNNSSNTVNGSFNNIAPTFSSSKSSWVPSDPNRALSQHIQRQAIVEICNLFGGRVLDLTPDHIMCELTGKSQRIDAFIELVRPFGIVELARSGTLAMLRGAITNVLSKNTNSTSRDQQQQTNQVDETALPPG